MMDKKTLFTIDYYEKEDFINQSEIDKLIGSIDKNSLIDYDYIEGNAKTSIGVSQNQFLDFHKDLEERIVKEIPIRNQRMAESWVTIQKEDSKITLHRDQAHAWFFTSSGVTCEDFEAICYYAGLPPSKVRTFAYEVIQSGDSDNVRRKLQKFI